MSPAALQPDRGPRTRLRGPPAPDRRRGWPCRAVDSELPVRHATTVVALRFADGIIMAGDRRATEGYSIAHRAMEKVFPADN